MGDTESSGSILVLGRDSVEPGVLVQVAYVPEGMEAIIFTADGDMRQALNNLQVQCLQHATDMTDCLAPDDARQRRVVARCRRGLNFPCNE